MSEHRREELIHSFILTFCKYGLDGTTTKRLAEDAGLSEAGLYVHFKNKEDILFCCVEEHFDRVSAETRKLVGLYGDRPEQFISVMFAFVKSMLMENRFIFQVLSHPQYGGGIKNLRSNLISGIKLLQPILGKIGVSQEAGPALLLLFNSALNNYILTQDETGFQMQMEFLLNYIKKEQGYL